MGKNESSTFAIKKSGSVRGLTRRCHSAENQLGWPRFLQVVYKAIKSVSRYLTIVQYFYLRAIFVQLD